MSRSLATKNIPVLPLKTFETIYEEPPNPGIILLGELNEHLFTLGKTGSGKDSLFQAAIDIDMREERTPIIFDTKMEYPSMIFLQQDPVLAQALREQQVLTKSYRINLWIPYTSGLENDKHFKKLLRCVHPKLRIRPFRILLSDLKSQDTKNWMLGLTQSQSLATDKELQEKLAGTSKKSQEFKEIVGRKVLIIDEYNMHKNKDKPWLDGWEYINFEEIMKHKCIHVISFYFMRKVNRLVAASTGLGIMNELFSRVYDPRQNTVSIYVPELQLWLPKGVAALENQVKTLEFGISEICIVGRSFPCRLRINSQNLNYLNPNMYSQARVLTGKTQNPKDLRIYRQDFKVPEKDIQELYHAKPGKYYDLEKRQFFTIIPRAHKARQKELFIKMYNKFRKNPENYLFDYKYCYVSDILTNFWQKGSINVKDYRSLAKKYFNNLQKGNHHKIIPPDWKELTKEITLQTIKNKKTQKTEVISYHG